MTPIDGANPYKPTKPDNQSLTSPERAPTTRNERAAESRDLAFDTICNVMIGSLERHILNNDAVSEAFRVLTAEVEIASLNDRLSRESRREAIEAA